MKKLVASLLTATMLFSLVACGTSDVEPTDGQTSFSEGTDDFIHTLTPTHTLITADWPFEQASEIQGTLWVPGQDLKDLSHLTNGSYRDGSQAFTWEEFKSIKVRDLEDANFSIGSDDKEHSFLDVYFEYSEYEEDVNGVGDLTVEEAIDQGYWRYSFEYGNWVDLDDLYVTLPDNDTPVVETIVSEWGMPSEVYYRDGYEGMLDFKLIYETENCFISLRGINADHLYEPTLMYIDVYGKKNTFFIDTTFIKFE